MSTQKINQEEAALRRINIFRNRQRQYIYVRKWLKKAYVINKSDFRAIGYYQNRLFLIILAFIFTLILMNSVWPWPFAVALSVWAASEAFFHFVVIKKLSSTKMPEYANVGFIQSALLEDNKITNIKMVSYFVIGIVAIITIVTGDYEGFYLAGMIGIALFGFIQTGFHIYVQTLRKKGTKQ
jgi:hypothetical protein